VVVIDGEIVSRGRASHQHSRSQLRHAELNAMLDGGEQLWQEYRRAVLFTTLEPCPLCLGAAVMADIPHIVFGLHDRVVLSGLTLVSSPYIQRHIKSYYGGVLEEKSKAILERYNPKELDYIMTGTVPCSMQWYASIAGAAWGFSVMRPSMAKAQQLKPK
jgi:tRNA(adenine34) deaminase